MLQLVDGGVFNAEALAEGHGVPRRRRSIAVRG